ncbi:MazG nucleotide pyrophosphohydrolase domain-containing protein [Sinomonas atrocyanea]|uniref:MazG nucleotide pyrophosphohydrolase domain-containing protein n=1 Tax=Sinomonas atrocyanea TaxID=37927 RepID=UPI00277FB84D|nr:MazG nucleotide pyrophosphohydrolase domain-containing protein [Sinomonas atrocyanea]MDQ0259378.1 XTP/dITP diphosphohydrolase [Sinomonas atrocyanea]MDR6621217.1 XTP/dITP diphosphohydrolase [Sinomonas atrocyanea]
MSAAVDRLVEVVRLLREHCLWTAALTHASLVTYLIEESYELVEAIEDGQPEEELRGELADVLLQVVLHAEIARERGAFDLDGVAEALTAKLVRRNRHVFTPDGALQPGFPTTVEEIIASWDEAKREEKAAGAGQDPAHGREASPRLVGPDALEGLPRHLPALALAQKALGRAERRRALDGAVGAGGMTDGPTSAPHGATSAGFATEEELGDFLLDTVRAARALGLDAERALRAAVGRL